MSDRPTDSAKPGHVILPHKTLLEQMEDFGVEEFYVTLDLGADLGPDEIRVVSIDPKARS